MANLTKSGGFYSFQFRDRAGGRRTVRLGKVSQRTAQRLHFKLRQLVETVAAGDDLSPDLRAWTESVDRLLLKRLAAAGLVHPGTGTTVAELAGKYEAAKRPTVKPITMIRFAQGVASITRHLGDRTVRSVTNGDARDYRTALLGEGLAEATVRKRCSDAREIFGYAISHKLIEDNPFVGRNVPTRSIPTKYHHLISAEDANRIMEELPLLRWRLLFALARWGGLRVPSEPRALT